MAAKQSTGNVDAKGAGVHSLRHDEPDGCGVGVPHELRPPLLQGEGRVTIGGCQSQNRGGISGNKRRNQLLDSGPCSRFGNAEVVVALEIEPELRLHLEIGTEPKCGIG